MMINNLLTFFTTIPIIDFFFFLEKRVLDPNYEIFHYLLLDTHNFG